MLTPGQTAIAASLTQQPYLFEPLEPEELKRLREKVAEHRRTGMIPPANK